MSWHRQISKLHALFRRRKPVDDLEEEIRLHLAMEEQENVESGMAPDEAHYAALRRFGNVTLAQERSREMWGWEFVGTLWQDLRFGARMLRKNPGFTVVAVLTLALGIGANTAIFSVVNGVLVQPLAFAQPDRLVALTDLYPQGALVAMRANLRSMEVAGYLDGQELNLTGLGDPMRLYGTAVSANFFSLLGELPEAGRIFLPGEDEPGKDHVLILSHALWEEKFGGDPSAIGRSVTLDGENRQIVGVMPPGFQMASSKAQFWVPLHLDPRAVGAYWGGGFMPVLGRLRPGVTTGQARAEVQAHLPQMRGMFPWKMPDALWASSTVIPLQESLVGGVRVKLLVLLGAIALVLLIACANAANLLLARSTTRQKEMAVRAALGAGRLRICRQLLTESILLGMGSGALGIVVAAGGLPLLKLILPGDTPRLTVVAMDWHVLAYTAGIAVLTGLIFGLVPALHGSQIDLTESLKTGWQHSTAAATHRLRSALAITEVALAVVLVIGAGLMVKSLWELSHVYPGFRTEAILTARIAPDNKFCADFARCQTFYDELLERTRGLPGVEDAAVANVLPLSGRISAFSADLEDHPRAPQDPAPALFETIITPDYFRLMRIPLLRGREFTAADMAPDAPSVTLITAATARKWWPSQDPIGKHVKRTWAPDWTTVVGVVGDVNEDSLASKLPEFAEGAVYAPYGNAASTAGRHGNPQPIEMTLVVQTANDPPSLAVDLRKVVSSLSPNVPVSEMQTLGTVVSRSMATPRSSMLLIAIFALLALVLGTVGIYGVISYSVIQRTAEIGIRLALGAQKGDVIRLVMRQGARVALVGVGIGMVGALGLTRFLASLLYGVEPADPLTFIVVSLILTSIALLASYIPAHRATKVDPMVALRYE
jgi:putative ABC transport system permease protein